MYSFGVTLWELITRERPVRGAMRDLAPGEVPDDVATLMRRCLDPDPHNRPTAREAYRVLSGQSGDGVGVDVVAGQMMVAPVEEPPAAAAVAIAPVQPHSDDDGSPPTPFAAACASPFASATGPNVRDAPLALRVAAAARAALARARRKREGGAESDDDDDVEAVAAFL